MSPFLVAAFLAVLLLVLGAILAWIFVASQDDADGDGLTDKVEEWVTGTHPMNAETDGDGMSDGEEFSLGTDPLRAETYTTYRNDSNEVMRTAAKLSSTRGGCVGEDIFDEPQGNTQTGGPDYEMEGQYSVAVSYLGAYTGTFGVLGVYPPSGTTTREPTPVGSWYSENGPSYLNAFSLTATGASFRPLKTGYYSFQAHADDTVSVTVGTNLQFSADFYNCNPGVETNALLVAGRSYPVRIDATSVGGPAELSFPVWGSFTPILKPQLAVKMSAPVVIFEDGYRNIPHHDSTPFRSTDVALNIGVRGGGLGGQLQLECINGSLITLKNGDDCRSGCYDIAAGETRYWQGTFIGHAPSAVTNDVAIIARFTENETAIVTAITNFLTIVQVELTSVRKAPNEADPHRHVFGVGEDVVYSHYPECADVVWQFSPSGCPYGVMTNGNGRMTCPFSIVSNRLVEACASVTSQGVDFRTAFKVYIPRVRARNPRVNIYSEEVTPVNGEAGHLLLYLDYYAAPSFISFEGVSVREMPDESQSGEHSGYFNNQTLGGNWSHTSYDCAGEWFTVHGTGAICSDRAGRRVRYEKPWEDGRKVWPIPMEYGYRGYCYGRTFPDPATHQEFELTASGTFSIQKFGFKAKRNVHGALYINGKRTW